MSLLLGLRPSWLRPYEGLGKHGFEKASKFRAFSATQRKRWKERVLLSRRRGSVRSRAAHAGLNLISHEICGAKDDTTARRNLAQRLFQYQRLRGQISPPVQLSASGVRAAEHNTPLIKRAYC